jgi:hypothetical protein
MDARCRALAEAVGKHVVDREFPELLDLFAPWLAEQFSAADLQDMLEAAGEGLPAPASFEIDEGMVGLAELRTPSDYGPPSRPIPDDITEATFRGWISVQFAPDPKHFEACNVCYDVWMAIVEHDGETLVGYFEAAEAS